jgi:deoxyribodipyrimidine photo-lyase
MAKATARKASSGESKAATIVWFRNDLRLADHRALHAAVESGAPIIPVFILDDDTPGAWKIGGASRWWLHHSLASLAAALEARGNHLILRRGPARAILAQLLDETGAAEIVCSRGYEPWAAALEAAIKSDCEARGVAFRRFGGVLLFEPERVRNKSGEAFRVYSPMWRAVSSGEPPRQPLPSPKTLNAPASVPKTDRLAAWDLLPAKPDWASGLRATWTPGEAGARARLDVFLREALRDYADQRNRPDLPSTSRLSPHLHFGEISPVMCWWAARHHAADDPKCDKGLEVFLKELVWREFSYQLLVLDPKLPDQPFRSEFAAFPWRKETGHLKAWQSGQTGYPIVDAGMRELWTTGWMHNRVRMIVGSFLVKHLLLPWQAGEAWFWDTLVDADLASNAASWQWVAGSGADAAPYFRIFNPMKQGETFDPAGAYVRRWCPELGRLPDALIHAPWTAPAEILAAAGVILGKTYPKPIVDHSTARERALAAFASIRAA